jgi:20S proteasome subunit alpha 1
MSIDEEKGPQIFKVDPAGHCQGYKGCTAGAKEQEANTLLEKAFKKKQAVEGKFTTTEATEAVIEALQNVIGSDFKPGDLEVSIATTQAPQLRLLTTTEVEQILNKIADKS